MGLLLNPCISTFVQGLFFLGYAVMQLPVVQLLAYVGARRVLSVALLLWGFLASVQFTVHTSSQLCAVRFLLGLAEAGYYPGCIYYLSLWLPDELLGTASAVFTSAGTPLTVLGSITAGLITSSSTPFDGLLGEMHRPVRHVNRLQLS